MKVIETDDEGREIVAVEDARCPKESEKSWWNPSIVSVALPLVLTIISIVIGDKKSVTPFVVLGFLPVLIRLAIGLKTLPGWKAAIATVAIWFLCILVEQKMSPEITCYRAAGACVPASLSLIPYIGPVLTFMSNVEQVRRDNNPDRIRFESKGPMVEKLSLDGLGLMFAFCFGALRFPVEKNAK